MEKYYDDIKATYYNNDKEDLADMDYIVKEILLTENYKKMTRLLKSRPLYTQGELMQFPDIAEKAEETMPWEEPGLEYDRYEGYSENGSTKQSRTIWKIGDRFLVEGDYDVREMGVFYRNIATETQNFITAELGELLLRSDEETIKGMKNALKQLSDEAACGIGWLGNGNNTYSIYRTHEDYMYSYTAGVILNGINHCLENMETHSEDVSDGEIFEVSIGGQSQ